MIQGMNGKQVKRIRKKLGWSAKKLGEHLGVTGNSVFRWEMGVRAVKGPALKMLKEMAKEALASA